MTDTEQPYTPSLEQMRDWYILAGGRAAAPGEFDRMIQAVEEAAVLRYAERRKPDPIKVENIDGESATLWLAKHDQAVRDEAVREYQRTIDDLGEELRIAREGREAALELMNRHRCGEQAESAYRRALRAEEAVRDEESEKAAQAEAGELEHLRAWKAEALEVLNAWERVWEAAGRPGRIGRSKAENVREWIEAITEKGDDRG